jgi:Outer membrane protein beta-barrel domain
MTFFKKLIISSLALLPFFAFSQNRTIDFRISPDYTYRVIQAKGTNSYKTAYDTDETGKINGHVGLNVSFPLTSKIGLRTGLQFSKIGYNGILKNIVENVLQDKDGKLTTDLRASVTTARATEHKFQYTFVNMPIACRFVLSNSKISPYLELGIVPTLSIGNTYTVVVGQQRLETTNNKAMFSFLLHGGLGIQYKINEALNFFFQPTIQYQLSTNDTFDVGLSQHLYSIGTEIGVSKHF